MRADFFLYQRVLPARRSLRSLTALKRRQRRRDQRWARRRAGALRAPCARRRALGSTVAALLGALMARPRLDGVGRGAASVASVASKILFLRSKNKIFTEMRFSKKNKIAKFFAFFLFFAKQKIKKCKNFAGTLKFRVRTCFP